MKRKKMHILIGILSLASLLMAIFAIGSLGQSESVSFKVETDKDSIFLGEVVNLKFELINNGSDAVRFPDGGVMAGNIEILIAKKGESYRKYFRSDWGRADGEVKIVSLAPKQRYEIDSTGAAILWNGKPNYSHLNSEAAKRADQQDNQILTDYAFPDEGTYLVKAAFCLMSEQKGCSIPIESEPTEIYVKPPINEDLEVWNSIKGKREIALLMQLGDFGTSDDQKKSRLITEVERILQQFPTSVYSRYLKPNLEKFKENDEKRQKFKEGLKREKN